MKKLQLSHTVLYFKGWYKITKDENKSNLEDLKTVLKADGYEFCNTMGDVAMVLIARLQDTGHFRLTPFDLLQGMENKKFTRNILNIPVNNYYELVIDFCMEIIINLKNNQWNKVEPDYNILPKKE